MGCDCSWPRTAGCSTSHFDPLQTFELRQSGRITSGRGVLVKAAKRNQDRRLDLPSIGPQTVEGAAQAGLAGIAVVAGSTIVAEPAQIGATADRAGLFVLGVREQAAER